MSDRDTVMSETLKQKNTEVAALRSQCTGYILRVGDLEGGVTQAIELIDEGEYAEAKATLEALLGE